MSVQKLRRRLDRRRVSDRIAREAQRVAAAEVAHYREEWRAQGRQEGRDQLTRWVQCDPSGLDYLTQLNEQPDPCVVRVRVQWPPAGVQPPWSGGSCSEVAFESRPMRARLGARTGVQWWEWVPVGRGGLNPSELGLEAVRELIDAKRRDLDEFVRRWSGTPEADYLVRNYREFLTRLEYRVPELRFELRERGRAELAREGGA